MGADQVAADRQAIGRRDDQADYGVPGVSGRTVGQGVDRLGEVFGCSLDQDADAGLGQLGQRGDRRR